MTAPDFVKKEQLPEQQVALASLLDGPGLLSNLAFVLQQLSHSTEKPHLQPQQDRTQPPNVLKKLLIALIFLKYA